jgi:hypothetical protein
VPHTRTPARAGLDLRLVRSIHRSGLLLSAVALAPGIAGCGSDDSYENRPRPAAPINVTAAITDDAISVSPTSFGAGPIVLTVSNQSASAQAVTFETNEIAGDAPGLRQTTTPINPRGTATLQIDVRRGTYQLRVKSRDIRPAAVKVGAKRPSAQDQLLQP